MPTIYTPIDSLPPSTLYPYRSRAPINARINNAGCNSPGFDIYGMRPRVGCASGSCGARDGSLFCSQSYPDFWRERGFIHPDGARFDQLSVGTGGKCGGPYRACLDPKAITYDKYGEAHCQSMCVYRQANVCVPQSFEQEVEEEPCVTNENGLTAIQELYSTTRGSRERSGATLALFGTDC